MGYTAEELKAGIDKAKVDLIAGRYRDYINGKESIMEYINKINKNYPEFDKLELKKSSD